MTLAPWLRPTDVVGSMQAGGSLGLGVRHANLQERAADQQQQSAADQLKLQYDQLWEQHQRAQDQMYFQQSDAAARLAMQSAQMALQAGQYEQANEMKTAAQALTERHYNALEEAAKRKETFDEQNDIAKLDWAKQNAADQLQFKNDLANAKFENDASGSTDPFESPQLKDVNTQMSQLRAVTRSQNASPDEKARASAELRQLEGVRSGLTGYPELQQQVTPEVPRDIFSGVFSGTPATTNYVPGSASAVLQPPPQGGTITPPQGPGIDTEAQNAYRAIQMGAPVSAVKARYKAKTGRDLQ